MLGIISTQLIAQAIKYYQDLGYDPKDVPLIADEDIINFTKPISAEIFLHTKGQIVGQSDKFYVASAEQSFLQLIKEGKITQGKYQALTPCLRKEPILDTTHYFVFLKLELISLHDTDYYAVAYQAQKVMEDLGVSTKLVKTSIGVDLFDKNNIELGSYGSRKFMGVNFVYGTGLAEPRFSQSKNKNKIS